MSENQAGEEAHQTAIDSVVDSGGDEGSSKYVHLHHQMQVVTILLGVVAMIAGAAFIGAVLSFNSGVNRAQDRAADAFQIASKNQDKLLAAQLAATSAKADLNKTNIQVLESKQLSAKIIKCFTSPTKQQAAKCFSPLPGAPGTNGVPGVRGRPGKSITSLPALNGKDGKDGKDGLNGTNGIDGTNGKDGLDGKNGLDGKDGTNGTNGVDGATGTPGLNGTNGTNGTNAVFPATLSCVPDPPPAITLTCVAA
jgi:Collagen triple helix repeat (20 copies)